MKFSFVAFLFAGMLALAPLAPFSDVPPSERFVGVMMMGEELVYEVSWTFFSLGKIRVLTLPPSSPPEGIAYRSVAYSDSYDLPFVDFHAFSTSDMDSILYSKGASLFEKKDDNWFRQIYHFDPTTRLYVTENSFVNTIDAQPTRPSTFDTLQLPYDRYQDGTSILYFARAHAHDQRAIAVPTLVRGKAGRTNFYFPAESTSERIDAVQYPIRVKELEGKAEFEGIFGLTGDFTGWFTDDDAAVPVKARMKVLLGSITLELKEWKRGSWIPPKAD
jgi:hypothetical protein